MTVNHWYSTGDRRMLLIWRVLFLVSLLLTILFIFGNSADVEEVSGEKSIAVTEFVNQVLTEAGSSVRLTEHIIRKTAHFLEYSLLGSLLLLNLRLYVKKVLPFLSWPLFIGLVVAVSDEYFQLFVSGRSGLVTDIVIDFAGIFTGVAVSWLAAVLLSRRKNRKKWKL